MAFFLENLVCYLSRMDLISLAEVTARGGGRKIGKINSQNFLLPLFELSETKRQSITSTLWQFPPPHIQFLFLFLYFFYHPSSSSTSSTPATIFTSLSNLSSSFLNWSSSSSPLSPSCFFLSQTPPPAAFE